MPFWNRKPSKKAQEEAREAELTMREVMAREKTTGAGARHWKERNIAKPFLEYRSKRWSNWRFDVPPDEDDGFLIVPEEMIGAVFPDDFLLVNDEWRRVVMINTEEEVPIVLALSEQRITELIRSGEWRLLEPGEE